MADDPFLLRDLWTASWMSKGKAYDQRDETGWRGYSQGMLDRGRELNYHSQVFPDLEPGRAYRMDRMLGWQSGGADVPPYGNWANPPTPFHTVAVFPGDALVAPEPPATPPTDQNPPFIEPTQVLALLQAMNGKLDTLLARATSVTMTTTSDALMSKALVQVLAQVKALRKLVTPTKKAAKP